MNNFRFDCNRTSIWLTFFCVLALVFLLALLTGCPGDVDNLFDDDEECLSWGENCTQDYKEDNYGTTDIYCCEGSCSDHGSGILTCGS